MSSQKWRRTPSEAQQHRCLLPGCPGSHRLRVRLLQPPQEGLVALPAGEGRVPTTCCTGRMAAPDHRMSHVTDPLPAPKRQHLLAILPTSVSPTPALHQRGWPDPLPHSHPVGCKGVLGCGQSGGRPRGQVPRDIRAVSALRGLMQCDTNIWTKYMKWPV